MKLTGKWNPNRSTAKVVLSTLVAVSLAGCALVQQRPVTPISVVVESARSGADSNQLISQIRKARTTYAMRGSDFPKLAERGVPAPVLDELQQSFFGEVQFLTRRWYSRGVTGGPASQFPQPLDLDNLDRGGNAVQIMHMGTLARLIEAGGQCGCHIADMDKADRARETDH